jgi:hypothetical protein
VRLISIEGDNGVSMAAVVERDEEADTIEPMKLTENMDETEDLEDRTVEEVQE